MATSNKVLSTDFRTPENLRTLLSESLAGLREGTMTDRTANSLANVAGKIFQSFRLQIEYAKHSGRVVIIPELENNITSKK